MKSDTDCVFCKIVKGEIPSAKVFETEVALAFMDIGPISPGHVLLIPKVHYQSVGEMPGETLAATMAVLPQLVRAVELATGCEGVNVLQNNGALAGQVVPHVHFHIIPRYTDGKFRFNWPAGHYAEGELEKLVEAIEKNLS